MAGVVFDVSFVIFWFEGVAMRQLEECLFAIEVENCYQAAPRGGGGGAGCSQRLCKLGVASYISSEALRCWMSPQPYASYA